MATSITELVVGEAREARNFLTLLVPQLFPRRRNDFLAARRENRARKPSPVKSRRVKPFESGPLGRREFRSARSTFAAMKLKEPFKDVDSRRDTQSVNERKVFRVSRLKPSLIPPARDT